MSGSVELELYTYAATPAAFLVGEAREEPQDEEEKHWIARSLVRDRSEPEGDGCRTYEVPEWWALEKGLI